MSEHDQAPPASGAPQAQTTNIASTALVMAGDVIQFFAAWNLSHPKVERAATVTGIADAGTVHLVADDGHDTPHENVPVIPEGAPHPESGPFAVAARPTPKPEAAAPAPAAEPSP